MKPYKKLFIESIESVKVRSKTEAMEIVDISNLTWSNDAGSMGRDEAIENCPFGWRLPTIQGF